MKTIPSFANRHSYPWSFVLTGKRVRRAAFSGSLLLSMFLFSMDLRAQRPLPNAHSHNNYQQKRPFWGALELGYTSIEADIHLKEGRLLVGHDDQDLQPEKTLQSMYLDPLRSLVRKNGGRIFPAGPTQILLIDIKTEAVSTYRSLAGALAEYADILVTFHGDEKKEGAVLVIVSGNRDLEGMKAENPRFASMDGRLTDLSSTEPANLVSMISDNWEKTFTWRGAGTFPSEEREKLDHIVEQAHAGGQWVRFWATPDKPSREREKMWEILSVAGVDLLNTDDLPALQRFLLKKGTAKNKKSLR